jgi:hypothetical protein
MRSSSGTFGAGGGMGFAVLIERWLAISYFKHFLISKENAIILLESKKGWELLRNGAQISKGWSSRQGREIELSCFSGLYPKKGVVSSGSVGRRESHYYHRGHQS